MKLFNVCLHGHPQRGMGKNPCWDLAFVGMLLKGCSSTGCFMTKGGLECTKILNSLANSILTTQFPGRNTYTNANST